MHFIEKEPSQKRKDFVNKLKSNKILRVITTFAPKAFYLGLGS